ncbi:MAG: RsmB/NOP family class I SAM-dependent RNA methyltransferase [Desulfurococcales archaeon]|nr:RsmB/NOP family class I SAM-dependent RNA methyltransferase [Desulfurococcales archaeon]
MGVCGTPLEIGWKVLARVPPAYGDPCRIVGDIQSPPRRLYVRVNTAKIGVDEYIELAHRFGVELHVDEEVPHAVWAPVEGPFQLRKYRGWVVADKRAAESVLMGSDLYAPGVIMAGGFSRGDKVSIYSPNRVHVGNGIAQLSPQEMISGSHGIAVRVTEPRYRSVRVHDLPGYDEGLVYGQSISSMYVGLIPRLSDSDVIVDLTAAPGGKVSHIAQRAVEEGISPEIIAVDRPSKAERLRETLRRLGLDGIVRVYGGDSRKITKWLPSVKGRATIVVVDPPCSNLGVRPKVMEKRGDKDIASLASYQRSILWEASRLLAPGGLLIYSTCTLTADENQGNRAWAIDRLNLEPVEAPPFRRPLKGGVGELLFSPLQGIPGFYIALLRRPG